MASEGTLRQIFPLELSDLALHPYIIWGQPWGVSNEAGHGKDHVVGHGVCHGPWDQSCSRSLQ